MSSSPRERLTTQASWLCVISVLLVPLAWRLLAIGELEAGVTSLGLGCVLLLGGIVTAALATALRQFEQQEQRQIAAGAESINHLADDSVPRVRQKVIVPKGAIAHRQQNDPG